MPITKDYLKYGGEKAGRMLYVASPYRAVMTEDGEAIDHDEFERSRTFPNLGLAKRWLAAQIEKQGPEWMGRIYRGCYRNEEFTDPGYGHILDCFWDEDEQWSCDAWQEMDGVKFEIYE